MSEYIATDLKMYIVTEDLGNLHKLLGYFTRGAGSGEYPVLIVTGGCMSGFLSVTLAYLKEK